MSATFAGSAYHELLGGGPDGPAPLPPRPDGGGGITQSRRNVPGHSRPAAALAADTSPSTVAGGVCIDATARPAVTANTVLTRKVREFMAVLAHIITPVPPVVCAWTLT